MPLNTLGIQLLYECVLDDRMIFCLILVYIFSNIYHMNKKLPVTFHIFITRLSQQPYQWLHCQSERTFSTPQSLREDCYDIYSTSTGDCFGSAGALSPMRPNLTLSPLYY